MQRRIGFHVSIEGGLPRAVERALERGCTTLQVFCGNPRGWEMQPRSAGEIAEFRQARARADLRPLFVHSCYLVNPASPDDAVYRRSVRRMSAELSASAAMGADCYVLHPGSHKGRTAEWGLDRAASAIAQAVRLALSEGNSGHSAAVLLENMAAPYGPGSDFARLGRLVRQVESDMPTARMGVAVDSCHAFGAGYDLRHRGEVERLVADLRREIGLERLGLIHVNDSRDQPGSRRDRHHHIGKGTIGLEGLRNLLAHPAVSSRPMILETPWVSVATDRRNLKAALGLMAHV